MAVASLKARVERLEAQRRAKANRVVGVVGCRPEFRDMTPERFKVLAREQQAALQRQLIELAADMSPEDEATATVGNVGTFAPLPPGKRHARFIEIGGVEFQRTANGLVRT